MDKRNLISPCGIDCFNCELYEKNFSEDMLKDFPVELKIDIDKVSCKGCREEKGCNLVYSKCEVCDCVLEKGHEFCFECDEFPCERYMPAADGADKYPHNMKIYNLLRIQKVGYKKWAKDEAAIIREKYFKGKLVLGSGPILKKEKSVTV